MCPRLRCLTALLLCGAALLPIPVRAWEDDGVAVAATSAGEYLSLAAADAAGGMFVVWDEITSNAVRAQRLDAGGKPLWGSGVVIVSDPASEAEAAALLANADGGCYVLWSSETASGSRLQAQKFDVDGNALWTAGPATIRDATGWVREPAIVPGPSGGFIVAWLETRSGYDEIYGQRVDADGTVRWLMNGRPICTALENKSYLVGISDGAGGAYFAWADDRSAATEQDVYVQRILPTGLPAWTINGVATALATTVDLAPDLVRATDGGLIVCWLSWNPSLGSMIHAQRYSTAGAAQWIAGGIDVSAALSYNPGRGYLEPDAADGVIVTWSQDKTTQIDVMAQRIAADGTARWTAGGIRVTDIANDVWVQGAVADGQGGVVLCWRSDHLTGSDDLFAQRLDADGHALWGPGGVSVCTAVGDQNYPRLMASTDGALLIAWEDQRNGTQEDVYAQRLEPTTGAWGFPEPVLDGVADVPADQGGRVMLNWRGGERDVAWLAETTHYSIWRATTALPAKAGAVVASAAVVGPDFSGEAWLKADGYYWEWLANQPAARRAGYAYAAATLNDSLATGTHWHQFQVLAHTADPFVFWPSAVDSGYSVDNLPPAAPTGLAVHYGSGNQLSWQPVEAPDLQGYAVYRGATADFVPGPPQLVAMVAGTTWSDAAAGYGVHYAIAAQDVAGNSSAFVRPAATSDVPAGAGVRVLVLHPGFPNPFNPRTTLTFDLPRPATVTLVIADAAGRRVRALLSSAPHEAGRHQASWDGRDEAGRAVAAGPYFARIEAAGATAVRRLMLVK